MKKAGIMGGTFNPIHIGHLIAAQEVLERLELDYIIFLPVGNPPHKDESEVIEANHRYEMVKLAIEKNNSFYISDIEIKREGKTYTYDTLIELKKLHYDVEFFFLLGYDTLRDIDTWKRVDEVFKLTSFIVVNRGNLPEDMNEEINKKKINYDAKISVVSIPEIDISSTEVRSRVSKGRSIQYLVPEKVNDYILAQGLYRGATNEGI